jgi:hypothetical protein
MSKNKKKRDRVISVGCLNLQEAKGAVTKPRIIPTGKPRATGLAVLRNFMRSLRVSLVLDKWRKNLMPAPIAIGIKHKKTG